MTRTGLRVLLTNNTLAARSGSELYVRDVALALMRGGHFPVAYSTLLGEVADELRAATVPVIDDLRALTVRPDVIHGQHHLDAVTAMLQFPDVPAVYLCHGWMPWEEQPPVFGSIRRYVAVDDLCRERLVTTAGIAAERIDTLYNFVDLDRFHRRDPLPAAPRSALVFSNAAAEHSFVPTIREACLAVGVTRVDVVGLGSGNAASRPERVLGGYDIVFAKARCALEAMAVGCATVVADFAGLAGMVCTGNMERMRRLNFGVRTMQAGLISRDGVLAALRSYDPTDARQVSDWVREQADMSAAIDRLLTIYVRAIDERPAMDHDGCRRTLLSDASAYLRGLAPVIKTRVEADIRAARADAAARDSSVRSAHLAADLAAAETRLHHVRAELAAATQQLADARAQGDASEQLATAGPGEADRLRRDRETIHGSRAWRAISRYRRLRARLSGSRHNR